MINGKVEKVYISSPYSFGNQADNVRVSLIVAEKARELGYLPVLPLLSHFWHFAFPHPYDYWMDMDLEMVEDSDYLIRIPGESIGADDEVSRALALGIRVFYSFQEFKDWHTCSWRIIKDKDRLFPNATMYERMSE